MVLYMPDFFSVIYREEVNKRKYLGLSVDEKNMISNKQKEYSPRLKKAEWNVSSILDTNRNV